MRASARGRHAIAYVLVLHESSEPLAQRGGERVRTERRHRVSSNRTRVEVHAQHWQQVVQRPVEQPPVLGARRRTRARREERELQVRVAEREVLLEELQVARVDRPERRHKTRTREETMRRKHALHRTQQESVPKASSQELLEFEIGLETNTYGYCTMKWEHHRSAYEEHEEERHERVAADERAHFGRVVGAVEDERGGLDEAVGEVRLQHVEQRVDVRAEALEVAVAAESRLALAHRRRRLRVGALHVRHERERPRVQRQERHQAHHHTRRTLLQCNLTYSIEYYRLPISCTTRV